MQVSDQLTGMLEVRAKTDEAAAAGQHIIEGFLTDPDAGTVYRSPLPSSVHATSVCMVFKEKKEKNTKSFRFSFKG